MKSQGVQERRETFHHTEDSNGEEEPHGEHTKHENDLDNEVAVLHADMFEGDSQFVRW